MTYPASIRRTTLTLALVLLLPACDSSDPGGRDASDPESLEGSYAMVSITDKTGEISGQPGTVLVANTPNILSTEVDGQTISGTFTFTGTATLGNGTYALSTTTTIVFGDFSDTSTETDSGTWTLSGGVLSLDSSDPDAPGTELFDVTVSGDRLTLEDDDVRIVLERR